MRFTTNPNVKSGNFQQSAPGQPSKPFYQQVGYSTPAKLILEFLEDKIDVTEVNQTGSFTYSGGRQ